MSSLIKYRVHEVAKDFGLGSKDVAAILEKYATTPKNHMQILTGDELNLIFDSLTLSNQTEDIAGYFNDALAAAAKAKESKDVAEKAPKVEAAKADAPAAKAEPAVSAPAPAPKPAATTPAAKPVSTPAPAAVPSPAPTQGTPASAKQQTTPVTARPSTPPTQPAKPKGKTEHTPRPQREVRVIDTRGTGNIDLSKYDERVDKLVPDKANKMGTGKEKIKQKSDPRRPNPALSAKRRQEEHDRMRRLQMQQRKPVQLKVQIPDEISVGELALRLKKTGAEVVKSLMKMGVMASMSQTIDYDTAALISMEFGAKVEKEVFVTIEERLIDVSEDKSEDLVTRSPVVVVMGHVDHGKTSLLDFIRHANVTAGEAGGITQHIGAYTVDVNGQNITFLDTPGHAAFTSMRMRGANVTDIAILVVAADDGIMPQTIEAINHAKAAKVPVIVAVNKMDKPDANPDKIMQQLTEYELVPEEWGGDTVVCKVSAHTGEGIDNLLEMLLLTAEVQELRANPNRRAQGAVIEARLDKGRGPVATLLVQNGTLNIGDILIAGTAVGRVRAMTDHRGERLEVAGPSTPVEITGLAEVPSAGDNFHAVEDERMARELADQRKDDAKLASGKPAGKVTLDDLFAQIKEGEVKDLNIIVKADVQGSAEALKTSLEKLSTDEVRVAVLHTGVGAINENDILLASTADAIVVGFNVRPDPSASDSAKRAGVDLRMYRIIYECIEEIEAAMKGLLKPTFREEVLGRAEVRQVFKASNIGTVAGSYVQDGKIVRGASLRVVRDGIVVHEGHMDALKRFKDDVREVASGYECGITIVNFTDIKEGDILEAFHEVEVERK